MDQLADLWSRINNSNIVIYALNGLGNNFFHIALIVRHRDKPPDFENTQSMVLLKETLLNNEEEVEEKSSLSKTRSSPTILIASNSPR